MYVRSGSLTSSVSSIAHHFLPVASKAYKVQPGGPGYELAYGATGVLPYLLSLTPSNTLEATFEAIARHEQELIGPLLRFLTDPAQRARGVRVVGSEDSGLGRVPTISFVVVGERAIRSKDVVKVFDQKGGVSGILFTFMIRSFPVSFVVSFRVRVCVLSLISNRLVSAGVISTPTHSSTSLLRSWIRRME